MLIIYRERDGFEVSSLSLAKLVYLVSGVCSLPALNVNKNKKKTLMKTENTGGARLGLPWLVFILVQVVKSKLERQILC